MCWFFYRVIIALFLLFSLHFSSSIPVECNFIYGNWGVVIKEKIYYCDVVSNSFNINSRDAVIDSVSGHHSTGFNDDKVRSFRVVTNTIHYFPRGIDKVFKNLRGIGIAYAHLKEIHKEDLQPFPNIVDLWLDNNDLQYIEDGLFAYNRNLQAIHLHMNKISQISPNVFDHLTSLNYLDLINNNCISIKVENSVTQVGELLGYIKGRCFYSEFLDNGQWNVACTKTCPECPASASYWLLWGIYFKPNQTNQKYLKIKKKLFAEFWYFHYYFKN